MHQAELYHATNNLPWEANSTRILNDMLILSIPVLLFCEDKIILAWMSRRLSLSSILVNVSFPPDSFNRLVQCNQGLLLILLTLIKFRHRPGWQWAILVLLLENSTSSTRFHPLGISLIISSLRPMDAPIRVFKPARTRRWRIFSVTPFEWNSSKGLKKTLKSMEIKFKLKVFVQVLCEHTARNFSFTA